MREDEFDIGFRLLDEELIDSDGRRCGKVDDVDLAGKPGEQVTIAAILVGPGAYVPRLPGRLRGVGERLAGKRTIRVPWEEVEEVEATVRLKRQARDLGLGEGDRSARRMVAWIPGSS
jgi:sporulation protein YlmC with PRC-barrel domain